MNTRRMGCRLLRIAVAMVFGFMSLGHGPVMTFAHAASRAASHVPSANDEGAGGHHAPADATHPGAAGGGHEAASHHHPAATDTGPADCHDHDSIAGHEPAASGGGTHDAAPCNAFGCFVSVEAPAVPAPALAMHLLGKLNPLPPASVSPASAQPADPPPRLHG